MPRRISHPGTALPSLNGLVVAGGQGKRLGRDKGTLDYHGLPQARWAFELLGLVCSSVYVAVRKSQASKAPYADLPLVIDEADQATGPAAGLMAAFRAAPAVAWLTLAADMPLVDVEMLRRLRTARKPGRIATAYRHPDGTPEPLCAIWEPDSRAVLEQFAAGESISLRRILERGPTGFIDAADAARLRSVNLSSDDAEVRARVGFRPLGPAGEDV